jgi:spermidine synthase
MLTSSLPYWPINPTLSPSPWINFQLDLVRCLWAILPAAVLWGASFPLALAAVAAPGQDPGRLVGGIYAANTVGAIFGALGCSLVLIPWVGTQEAQRALIALSALAGLGLLVSDFSSWGSASDSLFRKVLFLLTAPLVLAGLIGLVVLLGWSVSPVPWKLVAFGRHLPVWSPPNDRSWTGLYVGEGLNSSVAVTELNTGLRAFHVSGKIEASSRINDMRVQRLLGHLPALVHPRPRSVLVVGCGAGVTAGCFLLHPEVERIVICEIEPLVPQVVAQYFARENYNVVHDPRVTIVYDDARHYILTTKEKFDIITSDPIHPWVKGSATLYTQEYYELCKQHLNPGGVMTQWVPLYESSRAVVQSEIATFFEVFPQGTVWGNPINGLGYDVVVVGQEQPTRINLDELHERFARPDHQTVVQSLQEIQFPSVFRVLATYAGQASDLRPWLEGAEINRDRNLRLQFLAGMGVNSNEGPIIYNELLSHRTFPEKLFTGSDLRIEAQKRLLLGLPGNK